MKIRHFIKNFYSSYQKQTNLVLGISIIIIMILIIVRIFYVSVIGINSFIPKGLQKEDKLDFTIKGDRILTESKTFWGYVWFNSDKLIILPTEFVIEKNSVISGNETHGIPYSKVKRVIFVEGYGISEIIIVSAEGIFNKRYRFFVRNKNNLKDIKTDISHLGFTKFQINERKTLLNRLSHSL